MVVAIFVACLVYNTNLWPKRDELQTDATADKQKPLSQGKETNKGSKPTSSSSNEEKTEKQSTPPEKGTLNENKEARNVADQKPDEFAAITNSYDSNISKELKKANNLLKKGKVEDALRR